MADLVEEEGPVDGFGGDLFTAGAEAARVLVGEAVGRKGEDGVLDLVDVPTVRALMRSSPYSLVAALISSA